MHRNAQKSGSPKIFRIPLLTGVGGLQCTTWNATNNGLLTRFLKDALKFAKNFEEVISNGVPLLVNTGLQTTVLTLSCF